MIYQVCQSLLKRRLEARFSCSLVVSAGDEPDGSAKFFATVFRNERIKETVNKLIKERDGLILGICNGFQALIKLGLLPYGEITPQRRIHQP